jgi:xanthine dehydrogenase accessory factor
VRPELLRLASDLVRRGEAFAMATVIGREAPVSSHVGDVALVTASGVVHGWVGGSCTRPTVVSEALSALRDGRPRLIALGPDPEAEARPGLMVFPMACHSGGRVEIHIQPVLPPPRLVVFGLSPIARALATLGKAMGYAMDAVDPGADASAFPSADAIHTVAASLPVAASTGPVPTFAVVATQGQWDEEALRVALRLRADYIGVVASARRFAEMRDAVGGAAEIPAWEAIDNPAGLDIGAKTAEEVALSILAGIVARRRRAETRPAVGGADTPAVSATPEAVDPVCGMSVSPAPTTPRAEHRGRSYFFCCGGCRERFLAAPDRYAALHA